MSIISFIKNKPPSALHFSYLFEFMTIRITAVISIA